MKASRNTDLAADSYALKFSTKTTNQAITYLKKHVLSTENRFGNTGEIPIRKRNNGTCAENHAMPALGSIWGKSSVPRNWLACFVYGKAIVE